MCRAAAGRPLRVPLLLRPGEVLECGGLVIRRPHSGHAVPSPTAEEVREVQRLRALLETEALRCVTESPATEAERAAAREACTAAG